MFASPITRAFVISALLAGPQHTALSGVCATPVPAAVDAVEPNAKRSCRPYCLEETATE
ncbi:hypothetical protein BV20DRAFT_1053565 [Pilatotrama ljubarskyi]|nr:hypothetical protein BV20DRAFT_1053565 [Pilatotrama ljubarskyi]